MCNLSKGIEDRGTEKGFLSSIKNLMESMNWSPEQAMDALKLSADERGKYISALRQKSEEITFRVMLFNVKRYNNRLSRDFAK